MSHKIGQKKTAVLVSEVTMELILWEMAGDTFFHSSPPPCARTHIVFIIGFPPPNGPKSKQQGRPVLEIFRGR